MKRTIAVPILSCILIGTCIGAGSCAVRQTAVREKIEVKPGAPEENVLLSATEEYNRTLTSLEGEAMVVYRDPERTLSFRAAVAGEGDASAIRLDLDEFVFRTPLASVLKTHGEVYTYVHPEKSYYVTTVDEADFGALLGFEVPVRLLFQSLLGRVYIPKESPVFRMIDERHLLITARVEEEIVRFGPGAFPEGIEYHRTGEGESEEIYRVNFDKFEVSAPDRPPFPMVITVKSGEKSLEIRYSRVTINGAIREEVFTPEEVEFEGYTEID